MRRGLLILGLGAVGAALVYGCIYLLETATPRALMRSEQPELAWLKQEFHLSDVEFKRVSELHASYLPQCRERCRRFDEFSDKLTHVLATATEMTPELEKLLHERADLRATCEADMLRHFLAVSRTMPPEQGKRYLAWVCESTCLQEGTMDHAPSRSSPTGGPAHHP